MRELRELKMKKLFIKELQDEGFEILHGIYNKLCLSPSPMCDVAARKNGSIFFFELKANTLNGGELFRAIGQCLTYYVNISKQSTYAFFSDNQSEYEFGEDIDSSIETIYLVVASERSAEQIKEVVEFFKLPISIIIFDPVNPSNPIVAV